MEEVFSEGRTLCARIPRPDVSRGTPFMLVANLTFSFASHRLGAASGNRGPSLRSFVLLVAGKGWKARIRRRRPPSGPADEKLSPEGTDTKHILGQKYAIGGQGETHPDCREILVQIVRFLANH